MTDKDKPIYPIDMKLVIDDSLPPNTIELRCGKQIIRMVNVEVPAPNEGENMRDKDKPIWEKIADLGKNIPESELIKLAAPNACCAGEVRKVLEKAQEVKVRHLTSRDRYLSKSDNFRFHQSNIDSCQEIVDFINDLIRAAKEKT